ncbi:MAG TPA: thiamine pyrophosphate-binding protein [Patescibacteria group bacterium]|nr:thiamine pyrophosphate-binding protein [Patescibacteria group bacterium]
MNIAEYIVDFIAQKGVDTVFMITGGQAMFLNDAVYKNKRIHPIFHHHEQAAAMAAEAYGRIGKSIGVAMVTAGPAGINALTGVVGAYVDSAPMMVISGQSGTGNVSYMEKTGIRQYGLQGIYLKPIVQTVTKYFISIDDPAKIQYHMEKAYYLATHGRPGPVWIEVPLDTQRMTVPEKMSFHFDPSEFERVLPVIQKEDVARVMTLLTNAKRPLLLLGHGVHIAGARELAQTFLRKTHMPVITTRLGIDLIESDNRQFVGRPGLYGDRPANFAVQLADLIIAVGARLDPGIVGYDAKDWGRRAMKVVVDIDTKELEKPGLEPTVKIYGDAKQFFELLLASLPHTKLHSYASWIARCNLWNKRYPMSLPEYKKEKTVNSYYLSDRLSRFASSKDTVVVDTSSPFHVVCQAWKIKKGQRFLTTGGISTMGYWPAGIGACMARPKGNTIIVTGDGCLQMNLQELATMKHNKLPIKLFVINNNGYLLIRHTQRVHMEGRLLGESPKSGLWCPDSMKIAKAYGIKAVRIKNVGELDRKIKEVLSYKGPVVCDVLSPEWQLIIPRVASDKMPDGRLVSKPYEDLFPFLDRKEFEKMTAMKE